MNKTVDTAVLSHLLGVGSAALLMHINPDWDCLGSCLALREALRKKGVKCDIFAEEPLSPYLSFRETGVKVYREGDFDGYACLCCVDVGAAHRVGKMADGFANHPDTACIDHHVGDGSFAKISYINSAAPATGEIIYDMLVSAGEEIDPLMAGFLFCAISSDTGSFKYAGTSPHTMRIAAALMELGADNAALSDMLYGRKTFKEMKLQGEAISTLKTYGGGKIAVSFITDEVYRKYDATKNDTEALSALPRELDGVEMSAFLTQRSADEVRVSLRSKGDRDIRPAAVHFGGGGHMRASGCTIKTNDMEAAVAAVVAELEKLLQ